MIASRREPEVDLRAARAASTLGEWQVKMRAESVDYRLEGTLSMSNNGRVNLVGTSREETHEAMKLPH